MTTPTDPANEQEAMSFAEIRALLSETVRGLAETRKIVDENTRAISEMSAAIVDLTEAQRRTNQDVSTLKGWGLELYCERNPEIFAEALGMGEEEVIPKKEIMRIGSEAVRVGVITPDQRRNLSRADVYIYARRESDHQPFCLVVEASFKVGAADVNRAADRAEILDIVLQKYQPRNLNGQAIPIVAGNDIDIGASFRAKTFNVTYVPIQNGNQLTNPPE